MDLWTRGIQLAIIHHYSQLLTIIHHCSPLLTTIHHCSPVFAIVYHYSPSFTIVHQYSTFSPFFTICHHGSSSHATGFVFSLPSSVAMPVQVNVNVHIVGARPATPPPEAVQEGAAEETAASSGDTRVSEASRPKGTGSRARVASSGRDVESAPLPNAPFPAAASSTGKRCYVFPPTHPRGPCIAAGERVALALLGGSWLGHGYGRSPKGFETLEDALNWHAAKYLENTTRPQTPQQEFPEIRVVYARRQAAP